MCRTSNNNSLMKSTFISNVPHTTIAHVHTLKAETKK